MNHRAMKLLEHIKKYGLRSSTRSSPEESEALQKIRFPGREVLWRKNTPEILYPRRNNKRSFYHIARVELFLCKVNEAEGEYELMIDFFIHHSHFIIFIDTRGRCDLFTSRLPLFYFFKDNDLPHFKHQTGSIGLLVLNQILNFLLQEYDYFIAEWFKFPLTLVSVKEIKRPQGWSAPVDLTSNKRFDLIEDGQSLILVDYARDRFFDLDLSELANR
jgi:hypothetical protein